MLKIKTNKINQWIIIRLSLSLSLSLRVGELLGFVSFPFFQLYNCINLPRGGVRDVQVPVRVT